MPGDDPSQEHEYRLEVEKFERAWSGEPAMSASHFPGLDALRARLRAVAAHEGVESIEARLAALVDGVEAAWRRAETEYDWATYSDKHASMENLARLQGHLEEAARAIEAACRHRLRYYRE